MAAEVEKFTRKEQSNGPDIDLSLIPQNFTVLASLWVDPTCLSACFLHPASRLVMWQKLQVDGPDPVGDSRDY